MFEGIHPISITKRALDEIRKTMKTKNIPPEYGLRVGAKGGGCGVSLIIGFDTKKASDNSFMVEDVPVYIDKKHTLYLVGKEVDFYDGEEGRGFTFIEMPSQ